jgi:HD-GYP domain-containing protein (c-di-GMP phosphodiesterase class II)
MHRLSPTECRDPRNGPLAPASPDSARARLARLARDAQARGAAIGRLTLIRVDAVGRPLELVARSDGEPADPSALPRAVSSATDWAAQARLGQGLVIDAAAGNAAPHGPDSRPGGAPERALYALPLADEHSGALLGLLQLEASTPGAFDSPGLRAELDGLAAPARQILRDRQKAIASALAAIDAACRHARRRDDDTGTHLQRIGDHAHRIAQRLAPRLGLSPGFVEQVRLFAPLHDIGKLDIPDHILTKPGRLDARELDIMRRHVEHGLTMVDQLVDEHGLRGDVAARLMRNIVGQHHERGDGSGYPTGTAGDAISLEARIVAAADVFDALAVDRVYKPAWPPARYAAELHRLAEHGQIDAGCVAALLDPPAVKPRGAGGVCAAGSPRS